MGCSPRGRRESDTTERLTLIFTWCPTLSKHLKGDTYLGEHSMTKLALTLVQGFPCGSAGKESACNVGDLSSIPGLGRSPGEGNGYPLQYSGLENSIDYIVHGVTKSLTCLSDCHFHFGFLASLIPEASSKSAESPNCLLPLARKQESLRHTES